jgi:hypothetical protein
MDFGGPSLQPNGRRVLMDLQEENTYRWYYHHL